MIDMGAETQKLKDALEGAHVIAQHASEEINRLKAINAELVAALKKIAEASEDAVDPELSSETSWGNYDDCFYDGKRQARFNCAVVARAAIAKATGAV